MSLESSLGQYFYYKTNLVICLLKQKANTTEGNWRPSANPKSILKESCAMNFNKRKVKASSINISSLLEKY